MSRHSLTNKFAFVSLLTGAVLVAAIQSSNAAAQPTAASPPVVAASYLCSAIIAYTPSAGQSELYQKDFVLQSGGTFVDDFSTATREHVFTAKAIPLGACVTGGGSRGAEHRAQIKECQVPHGWMPFGTLTRR